MGTQHLSDGDMRGLLPHPLQEMEASADDEAFLPPTSISVSADDSPEHLRGTGVVSFSNKEHRVSFVLDGVASLAALDSIQKLVDQGIVATREDMRRALGDLPR